MTILPSRRSTLRRSLTVGVVSGAAFGLYDAVVVLMGGTQAFEALGLSVPSHVALQCAVGGITGLMVGALLPVARARPWGPSLLGFLAGAVVISALALPTESLASWVDGLPWYVVLGGLVGAYAGHRLKQELDVNEATRE